MGWAAREVRAARPDPRNQSREAARGRQRRCRSNVDTAHEVLLAERGLGTSAPFEPDAPAAPTIWIPRTVWLQAASTHAASTRTLLQSASNSSAFSYRQHGVDALTRLRVMDQHGDRLVDRDGREGIRSESGAGRRRFRGRGWFSTVCRTRKRTNDVLRLVRRTERVIQCLQQRAWAIRLSTAVSSSRASRPS